MNPHDVDPVFQEQCVLPQDTLETDTNGSPPDGHGHKTDTGELNYAPIPPHKSVTVSVRYRLRGRGRPLPYPLEEEDGE